MNTSESPSAAPTTRACQNCSKAKAKCVPQTDPPDNRCARCFRLRKECTIPPRSARKRRSPNTTSSTAQLEQKIESLVTLLAATQGTVPKPNPLTPPENPSQGEPVRVVPQLINANNLPWDNETLHPTCKEMWGTGAVGFMPSSHPTLQSTPIARPISNNTFPSQGLQPQESDRLLNVFREQFSPRFPFVIIPPNISADELRIQKPWLLKTVIMVASQGDRARQIEMVRRMNMEIAEAMLVRGERSLDMLEGLILFNSWSYYFSPTSPQPQSNGLLQLAIALVFDLALNRPVREFESPAEILSDSSRNAPVNTAKEVKRSTEERRALLSCYFLTSVTSLCVKKIEGLQHSPYIEYCCQLLSAAAEEESDLILVALVRLQALLEHTQRTHLFRNSWRPEDPKAPVWMHVKLSEIELQNYWNSLPSNIQQNRLFLTSFYSAEVFMSEPSLQNSQFPTPSGVGITQRLDMLWACLLSVKKLLALFLSQDLSEYFSFCLVDLAHLGHGLSTLFKLSFVEEDGWELVTVRQSANFISYFDQLLENFEQVGVTIDRSQRSPCKDSFPTGCARAMKKVKGWYEAKIATESEQSGMQDQKNFMDFEDVFNYAYFNDPYWEELMADGPVMQ